VNRYRKALKHLKSDLNESPTNSMGGVYSLNEPGHRLGRPQDAERFYPDVDGNFTDGIPGNPGDPFYLRPEGYWDGGKNWSEVLRPDASQEFLVDDPTGKSTDGLITEDGVVKTLLPPNSRHFILGPLVDGYVQNHGYDNYSNIGYIQKDTRQFVLLARIQGQFVADQHSQGARVWDGSSGQLTIYNSNFTLAMAEWFRDQITANTFTKNVPYFYSGGVPQEPIGGGPSCPNCPPPMFGGDGPGTGPDIGLGAGGGPPDLGDPHTNGPSKSGGPDAAGAPFPGANPDKDDDEDEDEDILDPNEIEKLKDKATNSPDTLTPEEEQALINAGLDDFVQGGMKTTDIFGDLATLAGAAAIVQGGLAVAGNAMVQGILGFAKHAAGTLGTVKTAEVISDVITDKLPGVIGDAKNAEDYNTQLAVKLPISILTGQPQEIKLSPAAKTDQINNVTDTQFEKALQIKPVQKPSAETTVNPTPGLKKPILDKESGWGAQGGSEVNYDPKTDTLTITSEKMLRTGQKGDRFDITQGGKVSGGQVLDKGKQTRFGDIPDAKQEVVAKMTRDILNVPGTKEIPAILGSPEYQKILKDPAYLESEVIPRVSKMANDATASVVQGTASNVVALRKALTDIGLLPQSEVENTGGGYGQVYSQTSYKGNEIPSNLRDIITKKTDGIRESIHPKFMKYRNKETLTETRTPKQKRILREIKQPIKVKEAPTKYKMNFEGKYSAQNTPDKTASAQSDALVASRNTKANSWRTNDKYWSGYETTERMNVIHDRVGHGQQAWDKIIDEAREKNGWRTREMQEELNKISHERAMLKENPDYTSPFGGVEISTTEKNIKNFEKVNKIKKVVSDTKMFNNKEIKPEYPTEPAQKPNPASFYKSLDPTSADSMPDTGNSEIDNLKNKAKKKAK
jgi:hypothetical protein